MYPELRGNTGADARELDVLKRWKEKDIFGRSVSERPADTIFSFYEGPPTVNGMPGIHHVLSRTLKDTICRYKTMQGYRVERKAGWDTHGLPVELAIEKLQGFKHKHDIIEFGIEKFNELCRASVYENISREGGWGEMTERMAYWVDMSNPYITCTPNYVESLWWALKQFHDKKLIYKGHKIQPYCPRCETALSSHEVSLGYKDVKDPSVFVKFKRKSSEEDEYFLAWTTTPWTLLANVALAVHPDVDYVTVINTRVNTSKKAAATDSLIEKLDPHKVIKQRLILAEALLDKLEGEVEIVSKVKGKDLEGEAYEPLFNYLPGSEQGIHPLMNLGNCFKVVNDTYVSTKDGTGIVHQAPAFGEDDYRIAKREGLPIWIHVTTSGEISLKIPGFGGKFFKDVDPDVIDSLKSRGLLYRKETTEHSYPFCWRCDTWLMYVARDSWYINVQDFKQQLIDTNKTIGWHPVEIRDGRFGNWLEELKDWGISRERFWGTPFPIWTGTIQGKSVNLCIGSFDSFLDSEFDAQVDIVRVYNEDGRIESGTKTERLKLQACYYDKTGQRCNITRSFLANFDPHKPAVDDIIFYHESGDWLQRVPDVIDVWFDSGGMPFAQYHYPFENKELFEKAYPADYISEGIDQTRGWFYTLHAINTFLFGKPPYKNVIVNDLVLDKNGQKMSKSKGNTVNPFEVLAKYGADAVRWNFLSGSVPWKPKLFNPNDIAELERKFFGTLTNTYNFFTLYANIDGYKRSASADGIAIKDRSEMDRWILSKLNSLVKNCTDWMNDYDLTRSTRAIEEFVTEELSNWYVRRSRRRFWKGEMNADKTAAYDTLYECLATIAKLSAPYAPFMSDILYSALTGEDSVHLALYPKADEAVIDVALEARMQKAQVISSLTRQMRERAKIKVRQPLERILIPSANRREIEELRKVEDIIIDEVNVKRVEYILYGDSDVIKRKAKANFKVLGAKLGKDMKTVAAAIGAWKETDIQTFDSQGFIEIPVGETTYKIVRSDVDITAEDVEGWLVSSEGGVTVALDTSLSPALISEGIAREFVNRIQNLRKDSGFEVTDRISIAVGGAPEALVNALKEHESYISQETLAHSVSANGGVSDGTDIDLGELTAKVKIEKR